MYKHKQVNKIDSLTRIKKCININKIDRLNDLKGVTGNVWYTLI